VLSKPKKENKMTLVKHRTRRPSLFNSFFDDFATKDLMFPSNFNLSDKGFRPSVNISNNEKDFGLEFAVPGFDKGDFEISAKDGILHVKAEKKTETEEKEENYTRKEFHYSNFERSFSIPDNVNDEAISAKYENGILHVSLPKMEKPAVDNGKRIEIA
jgi:HSP20 family protein